MTIINEALDYLDMQDQVDNTITVDEYSAKIGNDKDIVTVTFKVHSKLAGEDLVTWLERGYDFVLDASISDGELEPGVWLVFVEMDRRLRVPNRIIEILNDLETLTGFKVKDWNVDIEGDTYDADEEILRQKMILNPNEYKRLRQGEEIEMNEVRSLAGIEPKKIYENKDEYLKNLQAIARI